MITVGLSLTSHHHRLSGISTYRLTAFVREMNTLPMIHWSVALPLNLKKIDLPVFAKCVVYFVEGKSVCLQLQFDECVFSVVCLR